MKAKVNEGCIGCGLCTSVCPEVFRMGDEGLSEAYGEITPELVENAETARDGCPVAVISIEE